MWRSQKADAAPRRCSPMFGSAAMKYLGNDTEMLINPQPAELQTIKTPPTVPYHHYFTLFSIPSFVPPTPSNPAEILGKSEFTKQQVSPLMQRNLIAISPQSFAPLPNPEIPTSEHSQADSAVPGRAPDPKRRDTPCFPIRPGSSSSDETPLHQSKHNTTE